jgi:hypothetical protein
MSQFSLETATQLYVKHNAVDYTLKTKYRQRVQHEIQKAIKEHRAELLYNVPKFIPGPYPIPEHALMVSFVVKELREAKFTVEVLDYQQGLIRVSGWKEKLDKEKQEEDVIEIVPKGQSLSERLSKLRAYRQ